MQLDSRPRTRARRLPAIFALTCALLATGACGGGGGAGDLGGSPVALSSPEMTLQHILSIHATATFLAAVSGPAVDPGAPPLRYAWSLRDGRGVLGPNAEPSLVTSEASVEFEARALGSERVVVEVTTNPSEGEGVLVGSASFDFEITSGGIEICDNETARLLYAYQGDVWESDLNAMNPHVIANGFAGGTLSPTGQNLALTKQSTVYVADCDGGSVRRLTNNGPGESFGGPTWTPDGLRLVVQHVAPEDSSIFPFRTASIELSFVDPDTGAVTRWTNPLDAYNYQGGWSFSPDGTELATLRVDITDFPSNALVVLNLNSGSERVLVDLEGNAADGVDWSPAGDKIAFTWNGPGKVVRRGIYVVASGGGAPALIFEGSANGPRWIEGGDALLFTMVGEPGNIEIWRVGANGSGLQQLTNSPGNESALSVYEPR